MREFHWFVHTVSTVIQFGWSCVDNTAQYVGHIVGGLF